MDWQDELKRLDNRLADGKISVADYRRIRDDLLARTAGSPGPRPTSTAVAGRHSVDPHDEDRTQIVKAADLPAAPSTPQPAPGQPAWYPVQGEDVFAVNRPQRDTKRFIGPIAGLLVVVLVALAGWWLLRKDDNPAPAANPPSAVTIADLPNPTDQPLSLSGSLTLQQALDNTVLGKDEATALQKVGVQQLLYRTVNVKDTGYNIYVFPTENSADAKKISDAVIARERAAGVGDAGVGQLPAGVTAVRYVGVDVMYEAIYPSARGAVRVVIFHKGTIDQNVMADALRHSVNLCAQNLAVT